VPLTPPLAGIALPPLPGPVSDFPPLPLPPLPVWLDRPPDPGAPPLPGGSEPLDEQEAARIENATTIDLTERMGVMKFSDVSKPEHPSVGRLVKTGIIHPVGPR
jgi:hypothetical protein